MDVRVLGPLEIAAGGRPLAVRGARRRLLLATFVLHRNLVVSLDQLIDVLFGDEPPARAAGTVQSYVSRLRSDLGEAGERLRTRPGGYALTIHDEELDAACFERRVNDALAVLADDPAKADGLLIEGLSWWRSGRAFGEFTDDAALQAEATRLGEVRQRASEGLVDARLALADNAGAIELLETSIPEWPLRERFREQQMLALYRSGRQPEALRAYQRFRTELGNELGLDPSPSLSRLEAQVIGQDPELDLQAPTRPPHYQQPAAPTDRPRGHGNLPVPLNAFIGREGELAALAELARTVRLLTLTGPGGVGKTRLALRLAELSADTHPDGVWVCDLAAVREPAMAAAAITTALDVQRRQDRSTLDGLVEVLRPRRLLVAFDNCEHLLTAIGPITEAILRNCPDVRILATSREPLAVEGETVWPLGPLPLPAAGEADPLVSVQSPAVQLFVDRATAAHPDFRLSASSTPSVVEICRRLDGVPLALELAAARVRSMAPADIAEGLDERFTLLTAGSRTDPRHQTLLATVAWSYEMLDAAEQALFDRLSVFAGSFTAEDVQRVCSDPAVDRASAISVLPTLVDKSMVMADTTVSPTRHTLLETLREFGRQRLAQSGGINDLQHRHCLHVADAVERSQLGLAGPDEARWSSRFEETFDDLRLAHRWALAHDDIETAMRLVVGAGEFAFRRMHYELFSWAEATLAAQGPDLHPLTAQVLATAAYGRFVRGDLGQAMALAERALAVERQLGVAPCGLPWRTMANVFYYRGQTTQAADMCQRMVRAARLSGDDARLVHALYMASVGLSSAARTDESVLLAEESVSVARRIENPTALASAYYARALMLEPLDPDRAASMLEQAVDHGSAVNNRWIVAFARTELVSLAGRRGDLDGALRLAEVVIDTWYRAGDWANQWLTMRHVAGVLAQRGEYEDAATLHGAVRVASAEMAMPIEASDRRRVGAILDRLPDALGPARLADADSRGASMADDQVIRHAQDVISRVLASG